MILLLHCSRYNTVLTDLLLSKSQHEPLHRQPLFLHPYRQNPFTGCILNHCTSRLTPCPHMTNNARKSCINRAESRSTKASENRPRPSRGHPAPAALRLPGARRRPLSSQPRSLPLSESWTLPTALEKRFLTSRKYGPTGTESSPARLGAPGGQARTPSSSGPAATRPATIPSRPNPPVPAPTDRAVPQAGQRATPRKGRRGPEDVTGCAAAPLRQMLQLPQPPPPPTSASCGWRRAPE